MSEPTASETFRAKMSGFATPAEGGDALESGFLAREQARHAPPEEEDTEKAADESGHETPPLVSPEPEVPEEAAEPAEGEASEEAEAAESTEEPTGDLVELEDGTQVPLQELVKGHLRQSDYTRKTQELSAERAKLTEMQAQWAQHVQGEATRVSQLAEVLEGELRRLQPNPQAMARLRQEDPAEWAARTREMEQRQQLVQMARAEQQRIEQQQLAAVIPQQRKALGDINPAFVPEKFDAEYKALGEYALDPAGGGLRPDEWNQLVDHRHVNLVWKAREYDRATRQAPRIPKKLANVPRVLRPGASRPTGDTASEQYSAALAKQAAAGGNLESTAAAFLAREKARRAR